MKRLTAISLVAWAILAPGPASSLPVEGLLEAALGPVLVSTTETRITTDLADQYDPSISGNVIVYTDARGFDRDIWYFDLATGIERPVTTAPGNQDLTDVSDGLIAYTDQSVTDIVVLDTSSGASVDLTAASNSNSIDPAIGGRLVAWTDNRDGNLEVYARDLATGEERRISYAPARDERPSVRDGMIAWQRCEAGLCDVWSYDWASGTSRQLTYTPQADERLQDIEGGRVVYQAYRSTDNGKDICLFDLASGAERCLALTGDQVNPNVSGDLVAFEDLSTLVYKIGLWHLPSGEVLHLPLESGAQFLNDIDGNRIVYTDDRNGQLDIYMSEIVLGVPAVEVSPAAYDFGDVEVGGAPATARITVQNVGTAPLTVQGLRSTAEAGLELVASPSVVLPARLAPGASLDVDVAVRPPVAATFRATLLVDSDDPATPVAAAAFTVRGVSTDTPASELASILELFDASVAAGTLGGAGPGSSAAGRLGALRSMLVAAGQLIENGQVAEACQQLLDAHRRVDGLPRPPDFAAGPAALDLAGQVATLRSRLACH